MPNFLWTSLTDAIRISNEKGLPMFLYINNYSNEFRFACTSFETICLSDSTVIDILDQNFVSFGLNSESDDGKELISWYDFTDFPYASTILIDQDREL